MTEAKNWRMKDSTVALVAVITDMAIALSQGTPLKWAVPFLMCFLILRGIERLDHHKEDSKHD